MSEFVTAADETPADVEVSVPTAGDTPRRQRKPKSVPSKYVVTRALKLAGKKYEPGDDVPDAVTSTLARPEALVRAGLLALRET